MTLQQAQEAFLIEQQIRGNSPKTVLYYESNLSKFIAHVGNMDLNEITLQTLQGFYLHLSDKKYNRSTVTVQTYIRALRAFLAWCYAEGYVDTNFPERFKLPKAKRRVIDVLTANEVERLFSCFDTGTFIGLRNYCICMLMLDSGLRLSEVVGLSVSSLHIAEGYLLVVGKGNKERFVPLGLNSKKHLLRYLSQRLSMGQQTHLFVKDAFTPVNYSTVRQLFRKLKKRSGIERLRPHLLRHTFATSYLDNGGDIYSLQVILGHTSLEMVKKYVHTIPSKTVVSFGKFSPLDNWFITQKKR